jgi:parallel beta-helix repeat protein
MINLPALLTLILAKTWLLSAGPVAPAGDSAPLATEGSSLQTAIESASSGDTLFLTQGLYEATPRPYSEPICGNCVEPLTEVKATVGLHICEKDLVIVGESRDSTVIVTNAGYGILFERSRDSRIANLSVTGGARDLDGNATDAAIVVKNSRLTAQNLNIIDNTNRIDTVVVGIGGIFGREGSEILILNNLISNNGWDGIALYRGASAVIADNVIDGGRGAGIGITWDATAIVYRNRISGYWKGIGTFGDSWAVVKNNAVFDNLGWGIITTGNAEMEVTNNVIFHNGNCGFAVWEETARGRLRNNIIVGNGWREEWVCPGVGVWMNTDLDDFPVLYNNVWNNHAGDYENVPDQSGLNIKISEDPAFQGEGNFILTRGSPCTDSGDTLIIDIDGTRSDMGIYGGPLAATDRGR